MTDTNSAVFQPIRVAGVTGASGCVGQALLRQLHGACPIKALFRTESELSRAWRQQGIEVVPGQLADPLALQEFLEDVDVVFHCAVTLSKTDHAGSYQVNVLGTKALLNAAAAAGSRLFVHLSTISVYAATEAAGGVFTEDIEPVRPHALNTYSRTKLLAERVVRRIGAERKLQHLILRPTNVYGPLSRPWFQRPAAIVARTPLLGGDIAVELVHVDDVAKAAVQAAQCPRAWDQTYHLGHESRSLRAFLAELARLLGRERALLPGKLDHFGRHAIDGAQRAVTGTETPLSLIEPRRYPAAKARTFFGYQPATRLEDGLRQTVYWHYARAQEAHAGAPARTVYRRKHFASLARRAVRSEDDLVAAVQDAAALRTSVRALGGMGSKNGNFHTPGTVLDLGHYNQVVAQQGNLVTVQAGMKLADLYAALNQRGLALESVGEWTGATIAGAIATGCHGGSIHLGSMASQVESLRLVLADGSVRVVGRDEPGLLASLGISFGVFGLLSEISLRCVPRFRLRMQKTSLPFEAFLPAIGAQTAAHRYWSAIWAPSVRRVVSWAADPTPLPPTRARRDQRFSQANLAAYWLSNRTGSDAWFGPHDCPAVVGDWNEILAPIGESQSFRYVNERLQLPIEVEVTVPVQEAAETLLELDALFQAEQRYPLAPVGLRCSGAEEMRLSPCFRRDALWISLFIGDDANLLAKIPAILVWHHCRFHWSKNFLLTPDYAMAQYETRDELRQLKRTLDPQGIFSNAFSRRFGL